MHQVRNILKYVSYKDKKEFASDLKSIYLAATEIQAMENLDKVIEKWEKISKFNVKLVSELGCINANI